MIAATAFTLMEAFGKGAPCSVSGSRGPLCVSFDNSFMETFFRSFYLMLFLELFSGVCLLEVCNWSDSIVHSFQEHYCRALPPL
jgi:hypothetical protein